MSESPIWISGAPKRLLLNTDLSALSDRALDRAAQLAAAWSAELVVLNVVERPLTPDLVFEPDDTEEQIAERQILRDLAETNVPVKVRIARGNAVGAIRDTATDTGCGLIVTGMAHTELLGRFLLGDTAQQLVRTVSQPVLVVRQRVHGPYRRIAVATDFSDSSRHALEAAARYFPDSELILYHGHRVPLGELAPGHAGREALERQRRNLETLDCADFIRTCDLPDAAGPRVRAVVELGALESTLTRYVRNHDVDLVVMGTHGRSAMLRTMLGSTAAQLLDWLPCDTLVVPEPRARG